MQQEIPQTFRRINQQVNEQWRAATGVGEERPSKGDVNDDGGFETPAADTYLLRVGPELWRAVVREGPSPAEDTRAALRAIRTALDAVRRLRFAGGVTENERCRLAALAAEAVEGQERALWLWSVGRRQVTKTALDAVSPPATAVSGARLSEN